jgi:hypothetical protein
MAEETIELPQIKNEEKIDENVIYLSVTSSGKNISQSRFADFASRIGYKITREKR